VRPTPEQTILITGATDGLGRALATELAGTGATLLIHGRDDGRGQEIVRGNDRLHWYRADLASLDEVRDLAQRVENERLDVLVNNAGIGTAGDRLESQDGYELRFAVNYLAGFLLTLELLPLLRASVPARIVYVASLGQHPLDFDDLMLERRYSGMRAYSQSKLAQIMSGFELADRLPPEQITVNSLHPATYMPTKMVLQEIGHSIDGLDVGVASTHRLATSSELDGVTGRFFDRMREARADSQAYDLEARADLWRRSLELVDHRGLG